MRLAVAVLGLACGAEQAVGQGKGGEGVPEICEGNAELCAQMKAACPSSYQAASLISPTAESEVPQPPCSRAPGGVKSLVGGECKEGWICDINNVTGHVRNMDFSDACVQCTPGTCCTTMPAQNLTRGLQDVVAEIVPHSGLIPAHEDVVRLNGSILVYQKPCPRNYQCPHGMVDDARMVGKGAEAGEQCVSQRCKVYQGCPEGTDIPDTGKQKIFAVVASLVWYVVAVQLRFCHRRSREKQLKKTRSSRSLQLDTASHRSYSELHASLVAEPSGDAADEPQANLWTQVRTNWQEEGLRETGILPTRSDTSQTHAAAASPGDDPAVGALEAKAAALVTVGGKVKGLDLEFHELGLQLANGKKLLNGVTGKLPSGRLCAIMGPSGAGKTTFLYTLCGKATYGTMSGDLRINGEQCGVDAYRASFGFVPQEDVMLRMMTVSEICHFYSQMRLPPEFTPLQRSQVAETVIDVLGMSHVQDSKIGDEETRGISGGQRKRVNIAMELVAKPSILLLDEPTSGLDATSSLQLVKALRATAEQGICVAAVLHQPRYEMFCLFHDVLLLGKGGFTVYLGPAHDAKGYFESLGYTFPPQCNPADHIMDIIGGEVPHDGHDASLDCVELQNSGLNLARKWEQDTVYNKHNSGSPSGSAAASDSTATDGVFNAGTQPDSTGFTIADPSLTADTLNMSDAKDRKRATFGHQLAVYTRRAFVQQYRPFSSVILDYSLIFVAGAMLGMAQRNTELKQLPISGALSGLGIGLTTIISSTRCFGNERIVFWREAAAGLSRPAYFVGKNIAELPRLSFIPGFYLVIFTAVTGSDEHHLDEYWVLLFAVWAVSGLGYLVSVLVKPLNSQLAGVLVILVSLMCNGVFVPQQRMGRIARWGVPQVSFAFHMAKALYLLKEDTFEDYQIPNVDSVKFDASNACPLDQACMEWVSIKDSMRFTYDWGPSCPGALCGEDGVSGDVGWRIPHSSMWGMFAIGLVARVACFLALVGTNRDKQV